MLTETNQKHLLGILDYAKAIASKLQNTNTKRNDIERRKRTLAEIEHNTIIGKIAEYLLYICFPDQFSKPNFDKKSGADPGWDVTHIKTGLNVDVKKQYDTKHFNLKRNNFVCDAFAIFSNIEYDLDTGEMKGMFEGFLDAYDVKLQLRNSENPHYIKLGYDFYVFWNEVKMYSDIEEIYLQKKLRKNF